MARHDLARWIGQAGDAAAARDQYLKMLRIRERVLGPEHPETLLTRSGLARWIGEAGDAVAARDLLTGLLPMREQVSGPEHPDTLTTRHELAYWTERATEHGPGTARSSSRMFTCAGFAGKPS